MISGFKAAGLAAAIITVAACSAEQRDTIDSAAGAAESYARTSLSVIDVDMGRSAGADKSITNETETFSRSDTIYASVNMSGTAEDGAVVSSWTFPDSSVVDQKADSATGGTDGRLLFFITKPEGLAPGKYTFRVIVDGREVRSKDVTVQ